MVLGAKALAEGLDGGAEGVEVGGGVGVGEEVAQRLVGEHGREALAERRLEGAHGLGAEALLEAGEALGVRGVGRPVHEGVDGAGGGEEAGELGVVELAGFGAREREGLADDVARLGRLEEVARLLLALFLILFGGAIVNGLVAGLEWRAWGFAALFIFGVRPLAGWLGLVGGALPGPQRWAVAFLGIRGIGSLFYLTWAFAQADFPARALVYQTLAAVILLSLVSHGLTARTILAWAHPEGERERDYEVEGELARG